MRRLSQLTKMVEEVLQTNPKSRDSDQYLTLYIWLKYFPSKIRQDEFGKKMIRLLDIMELPREDNVKRIRAKFNEKGKYLSLDPKVLKRRKQLQKNWKENLNKIQ